MKHVTLTFASLDTLYFWHASGASNRHL